MISISIFVIAVIGAVLFHICSSIFGTAAIYEWYNNLSEEDKKKPEVNRYVLQYECGDFNCNDYRGPWTKSK